MEVWIGPAIVAALVSATVSAIGWLVTFRATLRLEQLRRDEKVHDFQVALRAEISSDLLNMVVFDRAELLREIAKSYSEDDNYSVVVPHMADNVIFDAIVSQIHVLPGNVIAPVVHYARLRQTLERFVLDMRAESFADLAADRQLAMYSDYLDSLDRLEALAQAAFVALSSSLGLSSLVEDPSSQGGAPGSDAALAEGSVSP